MLPPNNLDLQGGKQIHYLRTMLAYLIDDEQDANDVMTWLIEKYCPSITATRAFNKPKEAIKAINQQAPDLVFLDVDMPGSNGFDLLKQIQPVSFPVIFVTAYESYALKAIKVSALDYLLKPVDKDELIKAMAKMKTAPKQQEIDQLLQALQGPKKIAIQHDGQTSFFKPEEIVHLEADRGYTTVHLNQGKSLVISKTLKEVESWLNHTNFIRVHHSFVINTEHVRSLVKGLHPRITLDNGVDVPISRAKKTEVLKILGS